MTTSELTADFVLTRHTYGSDPEQFGELRLPAQAGPGPFPSIVYIHGGGYRAQVTLAGAVGITSALTRLGYATWSIEYRRVGNGRVARHFRRRARRRQSPEQAGGGCADRP